MLQKNTIVIGLVFQVFLWGIFLSVPTLVYAKTIYVNQDGDDEDNGTGDQPFKTLGKAAEEVNEGEADEIKIGKGSFSGNITFTQGATIMGSGKGSTTITGPLTFKKKAEIKNVSIRTKSKNAVTLSKNTEATLKSVDIRDYAAIGIWKGGGGVLTVTDSRIGGGAGKAIYVEPGTKLNISGNTITNNKEEGIDIRQNTRGTIKNNIIENNSESGMEIIVGSSDLVISGNDIKKNGASGIAYQFYESYKKFGTITTTGNVFSGNRKSGIDCNKPQKGDTPVGYWAESITLEGNTFANNKIDISVICRLIEAKTEEEEKVLEQEVAEEEKIDREAQSEAQTLDPEAEEKMNQENVLLEELIGKIEGVIKDDRYRELTEQAEQTRVHQILLADFKNQAVENIREQVVTDSKEIGVYKEQMAVLEAYNNRTDLWERIGAQEQRLAEYQAFVESHKFKGETLLNNIPFDAHVFSRMVRIIIPEYEEQVFALGAYSIRAGVPEWTGGQINKLETHLASVEAVSQETVRRISKFIYAILL